MRGIHVKKFWKISLAVLLLLMVVFGFAGNYFYNYAVVPSEKDFLKNEESADSGKVDPMEDWFKGETRENWYQTSKDGLKLRGIYVPAKKDQNKTAIIAHGYMSNAEAMFQFAHMYHELGYNVLVPDARGHGKSEGDYIGFGWPERKDYLQWINQVLERNGQDEELTLYGISMGAATVMMTSGEKLPKNVKSIVEDCGYSSAKKELLYQFKQLFDLPSFPLMDVTSLITKIRAGYFFGEADTIKQLKKNQTPMLFIHGDADDFVPYSMLSEVYNATNVPKEKWTVKGAGHAKSYSKNPAVYKKKVAEFLNKHH